MHAWFSSTLTRTPMGCIQKSINVIPDVFGRAMMSQDPILLIALIKYRDVLAEANPLGKKQTQRYLYYH